VLRAGRRRLAVGWYQAQDGVWQAEGEVENLTLDALADRIRTPTLVCGELDEEVRRRLQRKYKNVVLTSPASSIRRPAFLAELAWQRWRAGDIDDPKTLSPIYLHRGKPIQGQ
jgi:tRNA threonylcarbamoyladenosine biosynthesis protein TsaB